MNLERGATEYIRIVDNLSMDLVNAVSVIPNANSLVQWDGLKFVCYLSLVQMFYTRNAKRVATC